MRRRRGFTLVEIMIALVMSAIVIAALNAMLSRFSYTFSIQEQVAQTQVNLRYAIEQVKDDLRRAGLQVSTNSRIDGRICPKPVTPILGVIHDDGGGVDTIPFRDSTNQNVLPDELTLAANYRSAQAYPARLFRDKQLRLDLPAWTPIGGLPDDTQPAVYSQAGFEKIFTPGSLVLITNSYGIAQLGSITAVNVDVLSNVREVVVEDEPIFATNGFCGLTGTGDNFEVNPVDLIEYRLAVRDEDDADDVRTDLVRTFLDADRQRIAGSDLVVGEYIVDFQVWFRMRNGDGLNAAVTPNGDPLDETTYGLPFPLDGGNAARPDLVRSAVVRVCARNDREDREWAHVPRDSVFDPLLSFDLDGDPDNGASRVLCASGEIELVNMTLRNMRPEGA